MFSEALVNDWERNIRLENKLHTLIHGMSEDVYEAQTINNLEKQALSMKMPGGVTREYGFVDGKLTRNQTTLLDKSYKIIDFEISSNLFLTSQMDFSPKKLKVINIKIALTDGRDTLQAIRAVRLRAPSTWNSLRKE